MLQEIFSLCRHFGLVQVARDRETATGIKIFSLMDLFRLPVHDAMSFLE